jgi:ribulose-phosphate 3-epimerase
MPHHELLARLRGTSVVLPSMLLCDFGQLAKEVEAVEAAGAQALHLDVMDGHFVSNMTYGLTLVEAMRKLTSLPLDVHLMISNPEEYVERYVEAGSDIVTIHAEAHPEPVKVLEKIRQAGAAAGLAINPPTPVERAEECLEACDLVLVMSVMPGFGGQAFAPVALEKLKHLRSQIGPEVILEVDGGVNGKTIAACAEAGANWFVAGSAIFCDGDIRQGDKKQSDYSDSMKRLTQLAHQE